MSKYAVMPLNDYVDTCDSIREKTQKTENIKSSELPNKIGEVYETGKQVGHTEGYDEGHAEGYNAGYNEGWDDGKQAEYDAFWDSYQENGNRTYYRSGFSGTCWNSENFKPKYPLVFKGYGSANGVFQYFDQQQKKPPLEIHEGDIDFSTNITFMLSTMENANITVFEMNAIPSVLSNMIDTFRMADIGKHVLHTIKLGVREETSYSTAAFQCGSLENVSFVQGSVIGTSISFQYCNNLTIESLQNIISVLKDYSGTTTTRTLTIHADAKAKLTDSEIAIATQKGWTIA